MGGADRLRQVAQQQHLPVESRPSSVWRRGGCGRRRLWVRIVPAVIVSEWAIDCAHGAKSAPGSMTTVWRDYVEILRVHSKIDLLTIDTVGDWM
jgi:hypothetical protein